MKRLLGLLLFLTSATACQVDFTEPVEPTRPGPSPALLAAHVAVDTRHPGGFWLSAHLAPGITADGSVRTVPDDTLRVLGRTLAPVDVGPAGRRRYQLPPEAGVFPAPLRLEAPAVTGIDAVPPPVHFRAYQRVGPDTLVIDPADTLLLEIAAGDGPADLPARAVWSLTVTSAGGLSISRHEESAVPLLIRVPASWLEWAEGEPLFARLSVREDWVYEVDGVDYRVYLGVSSLAEWIVVWADPTR